MNPAHKPLSFIQSTQNSVSGIPWNCGAGRTVERGNHEKDSKPGGNVLRSQEFNKGGLSRQDAKERL
jgi:hypothetical protein